MPRRRRSSVGRRPRADRENLSRFRERDPRARVNTRATIGHRDDEDAMLARLEAAWGRAGPGDTNEHRWCRTHLP